MTAAALSEQFPDPWSVPIEWWPAASILPAADGTWQPAPEQPSDEGIEATLYQITESDGSLYDVVAWEIAGNGSVWWLRWGRATFLGEWDIAWAQERNVPMRLVPTPRQYRRMMPGAACVLDWAADTRPLLSMPKRGWIIENPSLRLRVERLISRRTAVPIVAR
jgi:hypothetical protein